MTDLAKYEALLNAWRDAEARAEQVRQFFNNGGSHRLRVSVINDGPVASSFVGGFLNDMMHGKGFEAVGKSAIQRAEVDAENARQAMLHAAAAGSATA